MVTICVTQYTWHTYLVAQGGCSKCHFARWLQQEKQGGCSKCHFEMSLRNVSSWGGCKRRSKVVAQNVTSKYYFGNVISRGGCERRIINAHSMLVISTWSEVLFGHNLTLYCCHKRNIINANNDINNFDATQGSSILVTLWHFQRIFLYWFLCWSHI